MKGRRKFRSLHREAASREPKTKITIYTEGRNTEFEYFDQIRRTFPSSIVEVKIFEAAGAPLTIAKRAVEESREARRRCRKQSYTRLDEFWAVFDRDEHPNIPEAMSRCRDANIGVAFSDPCFELWIILHFEDFDRPDHRHDVQRHLENICPEYSRSSGKKPDCAKMMEFVVQAEERAERQIERRLQEGAELGCPHTTVYQLTRKIRNMV